MRSGSSLARDGVSRVLMALLSGFAFTSRATTTLDGGVGLQACYMCFHLWLLNPGLNGRVLTYCTPLYDI